MEREESRERKKERTEKREARVRGENERKIQRGERIGREVRENSGEGLPLLYVTLTSSSKV